MLFFFCCYFFNLLNKRKSTNDSKQVETQQPVTTKLEKDEEKQQQKSDILPEKIDNITKSPTKSLKNTTTTNTTIAISPTKSLTKESELTIDQIKKTESVEDASKYSPIKKQHPILSENINTSISTTNSGVSHISSILDQSSMSISNTNNNNNNLMPHNLNNINSSMLTMTQSDSFNVSSSGYNGSVGGMSSFMGGNVDISMDSVVDKFNDE